MTKQIDGMGLRVVWMLLAIAFLAVNYNFQLAISFLAIAIFNILYPTFDKKARFKLVNNKVNWLQAITFGVMGYFAMLLLSGLILSLGSGTLFSLGNLNSVVQLYSQTVLFFAGSLIISSIVFMFIIPTIESDGFFVNLIDYILDKVKAKDKLFGKGVLKTWAVLIILSGIFTAFHLTAKASAGSVSTATDALILVFVFALISGILVILTKDGRSTILMHIIANSIAIASKYNIATGSLIVPIIGVGLGIIFISFITGQFTTKKRRAIA